MTTTQHEINTLVTRSRYVYTFAELSKEAQQKVVEDVRSYNYIHMNDEHIVETLQDVFIRRATGSDDHDGTSYSWRRLFAEGDHKNRNGFRVTYSLGYCQGDGASVRGKLYADEAKALTWGEGIRYADFVGDNSYPHESSFTIHYYNEDGDEVGYSTANGTAVMNGYFIAMTEKSRDRMTADERALWEAMDTMNDEIRTLCREMARAGYATIEYYSGNEYALETIAELDQPRRYDEHGNTTSSEWWGD